MALSKALKLVEDKIILIDQRNLTVTDERSRGCVMGAVHEKSLTLQSSCKSLGWI